jgi:predicted helicase
MRRGIEFYNDQVARCQRLKPKPEVDAFVTYDDRQISWSEGLKLNLKRGRFGQVCDDKLRRSLYRPFVSEHLFFDALMTERRYQMPVIFPTAASEAENRAMCPSGIGTTKAFHCVMADCIPEVQVTGNTQCFPFYTYAEDGSARTENVTDWALRQFRDRYQDSAISKWDIFHYVYALLHHPVYRERYAANLRRDLPRVPIAPNFRAFAAAGERLSALHTGYESQPEYPLKWIENRDVALDYKVRKMRLSGDKRQIKYNEYLTLDGVPPSAFEYRLGNRSALEWVIDQYQVSTDARSGIENDPNRPEDLQYIVRLIGQVITVSLETVRIVGGLPGLE